MKTSAGITFSDWFLGLIGNLSIDDGDGSDDT